MDGYPERYRLFHPLERLKKIAVGLGVLATHHILHESKSEHFQHPQDRYDTFDLEHDIDNRLFGRDRTPIERIHDLDDEWGKDNYEPE